MACPTCGSTVLFGGVKDGQRRYCSKKCHAKDGINRLGDMIPADQVAELAVSIHAGLCPQCKGQGPVDIHKSYDVFSLLVFSKHTTYSHVVCRSCARKHQIKKFLSSAVLGWWSAHGVIITPIILVMNLVSMARYPGRDCPSQALDAHARLILATHLASQMVQQPRAAP